MFPNSSDRLQLLQNEYQAIVKVLDSLGKVEFKNGRLSFQQETLADEQLVNRLSEISNLATTAK